MRLFQNANVEAQELPNQKVHNELFVILQWLLVKADAAFEFLIIQHLPFEVKLAQRVTYQVQSNLWVSLEAETLESLEALAWLVVDDDTWFVLLCLLITKVVAILGSSTSSLLTDELGAIVKAHLSVIYFLFGSVRFFGFLHEVILFRSLNSLW